MEKVDFTFRRGGRTKTVTSTQAKVLQRAGLGTYQTRDMAFQPSVTKPMQAAPTPAPVAAPAPDVVTEQTNVVADDGLDTKDKDELHAIAKDRGVKVHHLAGADKVRAALREAA